MALRPRTPWARALLPATRCRASGQLEALLSSPVLGVRLLTALQVLQVHLLHNQVRIWRHTAGVHGPHCVHLDGRAHGQDEVVQATRRHRVPLGVGLSVGRQPGSDREERSGGVEQHEVAQLTPRKRPGPLDEEVERAAATKVPGEESGDHFRHISNAQAMQQDGNKRLVAVSVWRVAASSESLSTPEEPREPC